jgi:hypothetical protein
MKGICVNLRNLRMNAGCARARGTIPEKRLLVASFRFATRPGAARLLWNPKEISAGTPPAQNLNDDPKNSVAIGNKRVRGLRNAIRRFARREKLKV